MRLYINFAAFDGIVLKMNMRTWNCLYSIYICESSKSYNLTLMKNTFGVNIEYPNFGYISAHF